MNRRPSWQVYRGHEIERHDELWIVKRAGVEVHVADTEAKATKWIDASRERELASARRTSRKHK